MTGGAPRDPRLDRTEATVLAAVRRLLDSEGPQAVTFGRVSREAGVSRTTLYRHWAGPSELLADAWARVVPPNEVARSDDLRADLVELFIAVRDVVESVTMRRSLPALLAAAHDDPVIARLHAAFVDDRRRPIVDRLEEARRAGDLAPDADPDLLVDLLSGPLFYRQLMRREPTSDERVVAVVDAVLKIARAT
ncbi:MAG TPA: TetR/AcrR family transcriptional regulator [Acidimicrobiales bacterium]|jgi:AcrR family transcriptional regulator|nr:TetR/AcrR family transcriptional regulator [Acidimicrobiales bacterium]